MDWNFWKNRVFVKRNIVIAAVLLFVSAAAYLNYYYNNLWDSAGTMAQTEDAAMAAANNAARLAPGVNDAEQTDTTSGRVSDYFATARLTRQQSRDEALSLLETAASAQTASQETIDGAMNAITTMASRSLIESQIENELLAKDFADCVVYITETTATVVVPAPVDGLAEASVARITETVVSASSYDPTQIHIIEVKPA